MHQHALARRLERAAQYQAARLGYSFGDDSWGLTRDMIERGVDRMMSEGVQDEEANLAMAEAAVAAFVARMVIEAQDMGLAELREDTYAAAHSFFCPLWPIC